MNTDRILNFYLNPQQTEFARRGEAIFGRITYAVLAEGWQVRLRDQAEQVAGPGYHLVYNGPVTVPNCLCLRRCYIEPFYRIETTNDRWHWDVASADFTPKGGSEWFVRHWQARLFKDFPAAARGYIFMPLQGKLLERRHFQTYSPIRMIEETLSSDPVRPIIATLHPRETYSAAEHAALHAFGNRVTLSDQPSKAVLAGCDYVVTQNSSLALLGFFVKKPAVLFAQIDFHHIAATVAQRGVQAAFDTVSSARPYASYLHWFFKENAISAQSDQLDAQIIARLRTHGWPI